MFKTIQVQDQNFNTISDALQAMHARGYAQHDVTLGALSATEDFMVKNEVTATQEPLTETAVVQFCNALGIPNPFAKKIPYELLRENINVLARENRDKKIRVYSSTQLGGIIGMSTDKVKPFAQTDFLTQLAATKSGDHDFEVESITATQYGLLLRMYSPRFQPVEPQVGDMVRIGLTLENSDVGLADTRASMALHRLACQNGATVQLGLGGNIKRNWSKTAKLEDELQQFMSRVGQLSFETSKVGDTLKLMPTRDFTDWDLQKYWYSMKHLTRDEAKSDQAFQLSEDQRKALFSEVNAKKRKGEDKKEPLGYHWYEAYNRVTQLEKNFAGRPRQLLQNLGGAMLVDFAKQVARN